MTYPHPRFRLPHAFLLLVLLAQTEASGQLLETTAKVVSLETANAASPVLIKQFGTTGMARFPIIYLLSVPPSPP